MKKRVKSLILFIFFISNLSIFGQRDIKDSLDYLGKLAWQYKSSDNKKASLFLHQGLKLSIKFKDDENISYFYRKLVSQKGFENDLDSALYFFNKNINFVNTVTDSIKKFRFLGRLNSEMGEVYYRFSKMDKALEHFKKSNVFFFKEHDSIGIVISNFNIATIQSDRGNYKESLDTYLRSIELVNKKNKDYAYILAALNNGLSEVYETLGEIDKSIFYAKEYLKLEYIEVNKYPEKITPALNKLARLEFERENVKKAFNYLEESDSIINVYEVESNKPIAASIKAEFLIKLNRSKEALEVLLKVKPLLKKYNLEGNQNLQYHKNLGIAYYNEGFLDKAIKELTSTEKTAESQKLLIQLKDIKYNLANVYKELKKPEIAFIKLKEAQKISDSLYTIDRQKAIKEIDAKYQTEKKEKELLQTRTEKAETELKLSKTRTWTFVLIGSIAILLFLGLAIFQRNKRKHQLAIANQKEKSLQSIVLAEEKERARIARELHDGVVQQLGSVILKTRDVFSKNKLSDDKKSKEVLKTLENSNKDIRNISHQMMPRALSELGLVSAINDLLKGSLEYVNIDYTFEHFNLNNRLSEKIEITLYRITQELINNIIKHSKAESVSIQLINSKENIVLLVEDDGVGLNDKKGGKGIGFSNIKSRLEMINGEANFDKSPEKGTLVTVKIRK